MASLRTANCPSHPSETPTHLPVERLLLLARLDDHGAAVASGGHAPRVTPQIRGASHAAQRAMQRAIRGTKCVDAPLAVFRAVGCSVPVHFGTEQSLLRTPGASAATDERRRRSVRTRTSQRAGACANTKTPPAPFAAAVAVPRAHLFDAPLAPTASSRGARPAPAPRALAPAAVIAPQWRHCTAIYKACVQ